jgi:hypothetical protein
MDNGGLQEQWASTHATCKALGISRSTLQKLKAFGLLPAGQCYYRRGLGLTAPCVWNVAVCRSVLQRLSASDPAFLETYAFPNGMSARRSL